MAVMQLHGIALCIAGTLMFRAAAGASLQAGVDACLSPKGLKCKGCLGHKDGACKPCWEKDLAGNAFLMDGTGDCRIIWGAVAKICMSPDALKCKACVDSKAGLCAPCWKKDGQGKALLMDGEDDCRKVWDSSGEDSADSAKLDAAVGICLSPEVEKCAACMETKVGACLPCWQGDQAGHAILAENGEDCRLIWAAAVNTCLSPAALKCKSCVGSKGGSCAPCWKKDGAGQAVLMDGRDDCRKVWGSHAAEAVAKFLLMGLGLARGGVWSGAATCAVAAAAAAAALAVVVRLHSRRRHSHDDSSCELAAPLT